MAVLPNKSPGDFSASGTYTAANFNDQIDPIYTWGQGTVDGHIAATTGHGATGAVVGTTNTQSLTNKTLTAAVLKSNQLVTETSSRVLTFPTHANDTMVSLTSTSTMTNKTLTTPVVTNPAIASGTIDDATLGGCPIAQEAMAASATTAANKNSVVCTASNITVTLASSECNDGNRITVTDASGTAGGTPITVATEGAETINGLASIKIVEDNGSLTVEAYSSNWYIVS